MAQPTSNSTDGPDAAQFDWAVVLGEHRAWLRTVIRARLGEAQAVDEVFQELALAVVQNRSPLRDRDKLAPWLYQLAVRQSLLYRRQQGRRRKLVERYASRVARAKQDPRHGNPLSWLMTCERNERIREAAARLPRRYAEILMLKYVQGWSYSQLAERMGISFSAVEARLHRARKALREELGRQNLGVTK